MPKPTSNAAAPDTPDLSDLSDLPFTIDLTASPVASPGMPATYELALQELEQLVQRLESGQLPLDQLLGHYQRGAALLAFCRARLQAVEDQIVVLDGSVTKPWAPT